MYRCDKNEFYKANGTHFFVGQFFATSLLANLMAFVVAARCTIATVVFLLTTDAFTAALTLLFRLKCKQCKGKIEFYVTQIKQIHEKGLIELWLGHRMARCIYSKRKILFWLDAVSMKKKKSLINSKWHDKIRTCFSPFVSSSPIPTAGLLKLAVLETAATWPELPSPVSIALLSLSALDSNELARIFLRSFLRASKWTECGFERAK